MQYNMEKNRTIEIVNELLEHLGMNAKQLSDALGYNRPSWIYEVLNPQKTNGISKRVASAICEKWPNIDPNYLLTGTGTLLKQSPGSISVGGDQTGNINSPGANSGDAWDKLIGVVEQQGKQIGKLIEQTSRLVAQNQDLINIIKKKEL